MGLYTLVVDAVLILAGLFATGRLAEAECLVKVTLLLGEQILVVELACFALVATFATRARVPALLQVAVAVRALLGSFPLVLL